MTATHTRFRGRRGAAHIVFFIMLAGGCAPGRTPEGQTLATAPVSFYFVQLTDTHWGARDGVAMTRQAVAMINSLPVKIEFVAITGDLFSDNLLKPNVLADGVEALKGLAMPVYYVPGNHDLPKQEFARTASQFEKHFGPLNWGVSVHGVRCLFICTEMPEGERSSPAEIEKHWIETLLSSNTSSALIFMHRPPIHDLLDASDGPHDWDDEYDTRWKSFLGRHPQIKAILAGHFHRDTLEWVGDVPVYVAPALARFWDRQPAFRLYRYQNGRLNYWTLFPERPARLPSGARPER